MYMYSKCCFLFICNSFDITPTPNTVPRTRYFKMFINSSSLFVPSSQHRLLVISWMSFLIILCYYLSFYSVLQYLVCSFIHSTCPSRAQSSSSYTCFNFPQVSLVLSVCPKYLGFCIDNQFRFQCHIWSVFFKISK